MSVVKAVKSIFAWLWTGANGVRKVLHLLVLLFIFGVFAGALSSGTTVLPSNAALVIQPVGSIVEQLEGDAYDRAIAEIIGDGTPQTLLRDIVDALHYAKEDERIEAVVLDLGGLGGSGLSKLKLLGDAIDDFQTSGKPVLAMADYYSQGAYYLAARADEAYLHHDGFLFLNGFGAYQNYYKAAIDKLQIDWNVFKAGTHKSAVEPFTRTDMSDEDRESMTSLLGQLWSQFRSDIVEARQLDDGVIQTLADNLLERVTATNGHLGQIYVDAGLIDALVSRNEFREMVLQHVAEDSDNDGHYRSADLYDYLADRRLLGDDPVADENVGVIVASGPILNGSQPPGTIGGDSTASLLRKARFDDSVKAVVLRVDSPGGSVFASRVIGNEVELLKKAGKPVVASMSSVAASGGYWISMSADKIFASSSTITGSIGVFGMFPTFQRTLSTLGVTTDGIGSTAWAGELRPDRQMSADAKKLFQLLIDNDYDDFVSRVADQRGIEKVQVDRVAQGQVWTGDDALRHGLIDEIGTLEDSIAAAAALAELSDGGYGRKYFERELSATEQLAVELLSSAGVRNAVRDVAAQPASAVQRLARMVELALAPMMLFNDPAGSYAHCFCVFE